MRWGVLVGMVLVVLTGCGKDAPSGVPSSGISSCADRQVGPIAELSLNLDGSGPAETLAYDDGSGPCPGGPNLSARVDGHDARAAFDAPGLRSADLHAVAVPGRPGDLALVVQFRPRGGFRPRLVGYADGELAELTGPDGPIFDFVATDAPTRATRALCVPGGFVVTEAKPVGAVWDVDRTRYGVVGNEVAVGGTEPVAKGLTTAQLRDRFPAVVAQELFGNCRVDR